MEHSIRTISGLLGGAVICTDAPKCETCQNDAIGTNCAKVELVGGRQICIAKK